MANAQCKIQDITVWLGTYQTLALFINGEKQANFPSFENYYIHK